ncbi:MAG: hypothetical protein JF597_42555 [Streptomyces sp.]|uniref:hypothetical protein n=1 Tax=Streptomyces sp. TaxID=1931 RepID=UPI0025FBF801|nr:hypothetical protein [Streptomyces sp.]MBW8800032.1 hypothetical protein [Streptomyces sp.]
MGSLRNPVGPLPSSIYWRRRVFMLSALVVLALLMAWIVTSNGGGGKKNDGGPDGKNPVSTITPGPSGSGPAISQAPGGRDGAGGGSGSGSGSGSGDGSSGTTGGDTSSGSGGSSGSSGASGSSGSSGSSSGSGDDVTSGSGGTVASLPGTSSLPNCTAGSVTLTLRSLHNSYSPEQTPTFELTVKNTSSSDCKIDLGPKSAVLTITQASADDTYWSSADCPKSAASRWYRVPSGSSITYTLKWDRKPSAAQCATPAAGSAGSGTYLLEATAPGYAKAQASFVLTAD